MRREFPMKVRLLALARCRGYCEQCSRKLLGPGDFHYDHIRPDQLGGEPTLENAAVLCKSCHGLKTAKEDVPRIAKAKRQQKSHFGIRDKKHKWPSRKFAT